MNKKYFFYLCLGTVFFAFPLFQIAQAAPNFFDEFGSNGDDEDQFEDPIGIEINSSGNLIYIADSDNDRINVFNENGRHVFEFGSFCDMQTDSGCHEDSPKADEDGDGQFNTPLDLVLDSSGNDLYVVDSENDRIQRFDSDDGDFDMKFGSSDEDDPDYIGSPAAIAIQKSSPRDIYVASIASDSISVFDDDGVFLFKFGSTGSGDGKFSDPSGLLIDDSNDLLYVADTDNDRIQIFELDDSCPSDTTEIVDGVCFVEEFGDTGSGDGDFRSPSGLVLDSSNDLLYVADTGNDRIQIFELVDRDDSCPSDTTEIVDGVCFVEEFGDTGSGDGDFRSPSGLALDSSNDLLYVADTRNDRIQVFETSTTAEEAPDKPTELKASTASTTAIVLTWEAPDVDEDIPPVTGYKIEYKTGSESFSTLVADTKNVNTSFIHEGLEKGETYVYRVYAINSAGTSDASSQDSTKPDETRVPGGLVATAISPNQIRLSWFAPTETFGQTITGYTIQREIVEGVYDTISDVDDEPATFVVGNLATGKTYSYVVKAKYSSGGSSDVSNTASATPQEDSEELESSSITVPTSPTKLTATAVSLNEIMLSWNAPSSDGNSAITGYKIESKQDSDTYSVLEDNTKSTTRSYTHSNLDSDTTYSYKVSAINSVGTSSPSNEVSSTPADFKLELKPLDKFAIDEEKTLLFTVSVTDNSLEDLKFSLDKNPPAGAIINSDTGKFTWTPNKSQGSNTYQFDIVVKKGVLEDRETVSITVNDVPDTKEEPIEEPPEEAQPDVDLGLAPFVDPTVDPQTYVDRYNDEPSYKEWFEKNYPEYSSIYEAVGLKESLEIPAPFVDPTVDPQTYVDRYNDEPSYKEWFEKNYPEYSSIYEAVGLDEPKQIAPFVDPTRDPQYYVDRYNTEPEYKDWFDSSFPDMTIYEAVGLDEPTIKEPQIGTCGPGTKLIDGVCKIVEETGEGGGCLIATATFGSELASQVQFLREVRDNTLLSTTSGTAFMTGFNQLYYSFSPTIADLERENQVFKESVKVFITPMIATLSIMSLVDQGTESEVLGFGISVIILNIGMYILAPAVAIIKIRNHFKKD